MTTIDQIDDLNGVQLYTHLSEYAKSIRLISGDEEIYEDAPDIRQIIQDKIALGIREGEYQGGPLENIGGFEAFKLSMHFYQDTLYKAQWAFKIYEEEKLKKLEALLLKDFSSQLGKPREDQENYTELRVYQWLGAQHSLKIFVEFEEEITLEFKSLRVGSIVDLLLKNNLDISVTFQHSTLAQQ